MEQHKGSKDPSMEIPKIDMKDVDFGGAFKQLVEILKLNKKAIESVASNVKGGAAAAVFLVAGAVAAPLGSLIFGYKFMNVVYRPEIGHVLVQLVFAVVMAVAVIFVTTLVANKLFKGKGAFADYFRVMGLAYGLNVVVLLGYAVPSLAPLLGLVVGIWGLVIMFFALQIVFKLDNTNTILTIIVTIVAMMILATLVASLGYGAAYSSIDLSSFSVR